MAEPCPHLCCPATPHASVSQSSEGQSRQPLQKDLPDILQENQTVLEMRAGALEGITTSSSLTLLR